MSAAVSPRPADDLRPLYRTMLALGAAAALILALGLVDFLVFEPLGQHTGTAVTVSGVFAYDPSTHQTTGKSGDRYDASQPFAAVVDWASVPPGTTVGARWFNSLGSAVGGVGPRPAGAMTDADRTVPVEVPQGFHANIPGEYLFVVERFSRGQPVEVLARRFVLVKREL